MKWSDVAGLDEAKEELHEVVEFLRDRKRFERLGARVPRGILTGRRAPKTLLAIRRASTTSSQTRPPSSRCLPGWGRPGSEAVRGGAEERARDRVHRRGSTRSARHAGVQAPRDDQTLNQLLVELDGFNVRTAGVGGVERAQDLDSALLRPGRFDRQVLVAPPDVAGRESILRVHTRDKLASDVDLGQIRLDLRPHRGRPREPLQRGSDPRGPGERAVHPAGGLRGSDGADRPPASSNGAWSLRGRSASLRTTRPGHAVMSHLVGELFPRRKATIVSRGQALGYTLNMPAETATCTRRFVDLMMVFLAGRAAERSSRRITNGAANDLERVTQIARSMVFEYGMSEVAPARTMRADNYRSRRRRSGYATPSRRATDYAYEERSGC